MKVKCISQKLNDDQRSLLGEFFPIDVCYDQISIGTVYEVLAFTNNRDSKYFKHQPSVDVTNDNGSLEMVPLLCFEIVDASASKHWKISVNDRGVLKLWPEAFYQPYFHDDLSEGVESARESFRNVVRLFASDTDH